MAKASETAERLPALDGLRGAMALCVAFYHFTMWAPAWLRVGSHGNTLLAAFGLYSVQGFFVVSGLCFYHLYRDVRLSGAELARFHIKRFFRIAPLYYASLALSLAMHITVGPAVTPWLLVENVSLSFGFTHPNHALVTGGWSIGVEYVFYAVLPIALYFARRRVLCCAMLCAIVWLALRADARVLDAGPTERFHAYVAVGNHAFLFVLGALLVWLRQRIPLRISAWWLPASLSALVLAVFYGVSPVPNHFDLVTGHARLLGVGLTCALVAAAAFSRSNAAAFQRVYKPLGELSYGVYMLHRIAYVCADWLLPASTTPGVRCCAALALVVLMARVAYRVLEGPALRFGQRLAMRIGQSAAKPRSALPIEPRPVPRNVPRNAL